jgi:hypothetical protein
MTPPSSDTASPLLAALTARSERQAMDWGLALISQGIPAVIDREEVSARQSEGVPEKASEEPIEGVVDHRFHPPNPPHLGPSPQGVHRSRWCLRVEPDALERARAVVL